MPNSRAQIVKLSVSQLVSALSAVLNQNVSRQAKLALAKNHIDYTLESLSGVISKNLPISLLATSIPLITHVALDAFQMATRSRTNVLMATDKLSRRYKLESILVRTILISAIEAEMDLAVEYSQETEQPISIITKNNKMVVPFEPSKRAMRKKITEMLNIHPELEVVFEV